MPFHPHLEPPRPEVRAFLEDAHEHPDDDAPRLVLADWLDEHGDEADRARAELIRLQCLLARPGRAPAGANARLRCLLHEYAEDWLGPLARLATAWRFERGLLHLSLAGHDLFSLTLLDLVRTETFAWVEGLTLRQLTGAAVNVLEQQPVLDGVRVLTLDESRPTEAGLARLLHCPRLAGLRELRLALCRVGPAAVALLAESPCLGRLERLDLSRNTCGQQGLEALAGSGSLPRLRQLRLAHADVPDHAVHSLAGSDLLGRLEALDLRGNQGCGGEGLAALLGRPGCGRLRRLDLGLLRLRPPAVRALARSPHLAALEELSLDRTNLGNDHLKELALGRGLPALRVLSLGRNGLTDAGVVAWARFSPRRLRVLGLAHNQLGGEAAVALAESDALGGLEELDLEGNRVDDAGALALADALQPGRLRFLDVGSNALTALGKAVLLRRFGRHVVLA